jgi:prevent-host-death family protein
MEWQLADAKNKFSEVVTRALNEGPQRVHRRGQTVVILAEDEYDRLTGEKPGLLDYLLSGPSFDGLEIERDQALMRDVEL